MKRPHTRYLFIVVVCLSILACDKNDPVAPTQEPTGTLSGIVRVVEFRYGGVAHDPSGVRVRLEGTSFEALSDSTGRWYINKVPAGVYTIIHSKEGYSTAYALRYQFVGRDSVLVSRSDTEPFYYLERLPSFTIDSLSAKFVERTSGFPAGLQVEGTVADFLGGDRGVSIWVGTSPLVSWAPGAHHYATIATLTIGATSSFSAFLTDFGLHAAGLPSGTTVYIVAYPGGSSIVDPLNNRMYFTNLVDTPSPVVSAVVP